jgi:cation diffusion facilitator CzcD-associated flavoprotein CzcO
MNRKVADDGGSDAPLRHAHILIIGSGFSGLGMAIRLSREGYTDFLVLERGNDFGGTWRDNTFPGSACDIPSQLYSYSFALNPHWSSSFSTQPEIHQYIRDVADRYEVRDKHMFGCEMTGARWNGAEARWELQTNQGQFSADIMVSAVGVLCEPKLPDIKGIHTYGGRLFHSARWDHGFDLTGKRVAVIGSGASAIQIVPSIAPKVAHLDVYQRTAQWVLPRMGRPYTWLERIAFKYVPGLQRLFRAAIWVTREFFAISSLKFPPSTAILELIARAKLWHEIRDPELRRKLIPNYRLGCKRMLISNDYYPALSRDNVDVVTDGIKEIHEHSIVAHDGKEREVDAIVLATGFHVTDFPTLDIVTGRDGRTVSEVFDEEGIRAYKGTTIANFPNAFWILGPNSGIPYNSSIYMIESQINYIADAVATIEKRGLQTFEVRKDLQSKYSREVQKKMAGSVWLNGGCTSWFLDKHGNNSTLWPDFVFKFRRRLRRFDAAAYDTTASEQADRVGVA